MVYKDWTKITSNEWVLFKRNINNTLKTGYITIIKPEHHLGREKTYLVDGKVNNNKFQKHFKTKQQALKYARAYMRKH